jgi:hypothetical protein
MLVWTLALTFAAPVPDVVPLPTTSPPVQCLVSLEGEGRIVLVNSVIEYRKETLTREVGGKLVSENVLVPVVTFRTQKYALKDVQVFDTQGKPVDEKKLPELLRERTPALVSADGKKVDPLHLRIVKDGTLVLVVPGWQSRPVRDTLPPER